MLKNCPTSRKKNIEYAQDHAQADRKQNLNNQNRKDSKKNPAGEITAKDEKNGEYAENNRKVKTGI